MGLAQLLTIFQTIGAVIGVILTLITFWGIISKKPKEKIRTAFREEAKEANKELYDKINKIVEKIKGADKTDTALLRNAITSIYFQYKDIKQIPHYQKENVLSLYEQYERLGGNSYIKNVIKEIQDWEEKV